MEYRTNEQWQEICNQANNGNWSKAKELCDEYGFVDAQDMINAEQEINLLIDDTAITHLANR